MVAINADGLSAVRPRGPRTAMQSSAGAPLQSVQGRWECVDSASDPAWERETKQHPEAGPFHQRGWVELLKETYGHCPIRLRVVEDDATAVQVPLAEVNSWLTGRRGVSLPFTDACDALSFRKPPTNAFSTLCDLGRNRGWKYLELRGSALVPGEATPSIRYWGHELDLTPGAQSLHQEYAPSVRRAIRKAEASELRIEHSTSVKSVRAYYDLHVRTRRRHGVPPQPWRFFANIHRILLEQGGGFVTVAFHGTTPVAGAIFLHSGTKAVYKFAATDLAFQSMRPANLVVARAIDRLIDLGIRSLSFGRTSQTNAGLRHFKLGWGSHETAIRYFRYHLSRNVWLSRPDSAHGRIHSLFRHLPTFVNRAFGALLYPHLD